MAGFKNLPELVRINGRWVLEGFQPTQPAFMWEDYRGKTGILYVVAFGGYHKIGLTTDFEKRFAQLQSGLPTPLERVATRRVPLAGLAYAEAWLHHQHAEKRAMGEWFAITRDEALALLSKAVVRAKAYQHHCREWWRADRIASQSGTRLEEMERAYAAFLERHPSTAVPAAPERRT